ncbi:uncharacterized protein LOC121695930 isoform X2 [Alosa sapidissima]|uniref:uncharacterized protein LOC121695930 isoform X2 n=1 Tax=Alosa sapidissima TaxID=34773 RepID=UPI001C094C8C|nr:uncharacterized protein LOC121695930 isoform X2 [Alosa sapidissima]
MDDLLAGSEPHGKLPLKPPLWESIGDGGSSMVPTLALMEMAVAVNCPTRNENEPLDLVMLQRMVAESDVRAKYWSTVTMDLINTCTKVMQSANRDRQWFVHMVQQIEKTMRTAVHLQDDRKSHSQEAHNICCPSILRISSDKETEADDERYGLRALVEDCRSCLGSLERVVMQFTEKVEIALNIRHKDKEVPLCHYFREESSSSQASLGMCSSVGSTIERCASIHDTRHIGQYKDAAVQQATAIPDSKFEMMERGVLPDSQLCPPAVMRYEQRCEMITETENSKQHLQHTGRDIVEDNVCKHLKVTESLKSEVEEVVEAKLMSSDVLLLTPTIQPHNNLIGTKADVVDGADDGLELLKSPAVHENVGEGTSEALQLLPDPEDFIPTAEMATATPDSIYEMTEVVVLPDSQLGPPAVPPHNNLIGTNSDVVDGADDGLVLKSPVVHENMREETSKAPQQLQPTGTAADQSIKISLKVTGHELKVNYRQTSQPSPNNRQVKVQNLVHSVVKELWEMYDLEEGPKVLSGLPKPSPSEIFIQSLTCAQHLKMTTRRNYSKHVYELCWEILMDIYPNESETKPAWYKPRPKFDMSKIKSLRDVQDYITKKVFRLCGMPTPKHMEKTQFHIENEITKSITLY